MTEGEHETRRHRKALREAQNARIQGAGAAVTKLAMLRCHRFLRDEMPEARMVLTLHDELQFEAPRAAPPTSPARCRA